MHRWKDENSLSILHRFMSLRNSLYSAGGHWHLHKEHCRVCKARRRLQQGAPVQAAFYCILQALQGALQLGSGNLVNTCSSPDLYAVQELDFVLANVIMALVADFMLVWLPAPTLSFK